MRLNAFLLVSSLLAVALSGCMEGGSEGGQDAGPVEALDGTNETAPPTNATNTAPTADLTVSATNGTAPLNVTFTLEGSDADGDNLTWTFTVGNATANGTSLPANVNATLEAGNWSATLTVSDGQNETVAQASVSVSGAGASVPVAEVLVMEFKGTVIAPDPTSYTHTNCLQGLLTQPNGAPGSTWFDLPPETWGGTYGIDAEGIEVRFANADSAEVYEAGTSGTVPADANVVEACGMTAIDTDFTIRIEYTA